MKWSFTIARILGAEAIPHVTFLLVLASIALAQWQVQGSIPGVVAGLLLFLALLGGVLVHRFGHAVMARRIGIPIPCIAPLPFGRVACSERIPEKPAQELSAALPMREAPAPEVKSSTGDMTVREVMLTDFRTLSPDDPLSEATQLLMEGSQEDFPVLEGGLLVGVLARGRLLKALREEGEFALVRDTMERNFETVRPNDRLDEVLARTVSSRAALAVMSAGRLIGMLTEQNISERLMIRAALTSRRRTARPNPAPTPETGRTTSDADTNRSNCLPS